MFYGIMWFDVRGISLDPIYWLEERSAAGERRGMAARGRGRSAGPGRGQGRWLPPAKGGQRQSRARAVRAPRRAGRPVLGRARGRSDQGCGAEASRPAGAEDAASRREGAA